MVLLELFLSEEEKEEEEEEKEEEDEEELDEEEEDEEEEEEEDGSCSSSSYYTETSSSSSEDVVEDCPVIYSDDDPDGKAPWVEEESDDEVFIVARLPDFEAAGFHLATDDFDFEDLDTRSPAVTVNDQFCFRGDHQVEAAPHLLFATPGEQEDLYRATLDVGGEYVLDVDAADLPAASSADEEDEPVQQGAILIGLTTHAVHFLLSEPDF